MAKSEIPVGVWIKGSVMKTPSGRVMLKTSNPQVKRRKNVEMGYYDQYGFHPIRASRDYSPARAGESKDWRRDTKRKAKRKATAKRVVKKATRKASVKKRAARKTARRR